MGALTCDQASNGPTETKRSPELATIFRSLGKNYLETSKLTPRQSAAFRNITECQTAARGGHSWRCSSCHHYVSQYNSCLDRHCPKCQGKSRYKWVADRMKDVVNAPYYHLVFTLPHELNPLIAYNSRVLLDLLFKAVSQTLLAFGRDPKHLGGELGFIAVLHTWNQKIERHYHLHCIIPGGALSDDGTSWIPCKYDGYLFPEFALGQTFRRLYWHGSINMSGDHPGKTPETTVKFKGLKDLLLDGDLKFPPAEGSPARSFIKSLENRLYKHKWIVYAKQAFGGPTQVIKYLGCYTHRVAISNRRILSHANGLVTFSYKERKNKYRKRTLTLSEIDFTSRFLSHVLPTGFMKIRSFGFLANCKKKDRIEQIHTILGHPDLQEVEENATEEESDQEIQTTSSSKVCPNCQKSTLYYNRPISRDIQEWIRKAIWDTS